MFGSQDYSGLYIGMVEAVFPPNHVLNSSVYQYEYRVLISGDSMSTIPTKCVKADLFGNLNDYDDATLLVGSRVYVMFPRKDMSIGVIIGGVRQFSLPTDPAEKHHWKRRFNEIVQSCDSKGAYTVRSIDGPYIKIEKKKVTISNVQVNPGIDTIKADDTEVVESIVFDSAAKTLTVTARELKIVVKDPKDANGNISLEVSGNATVNVKKNATISVEKDVTLDVKGKMQATIGKDLIADVKGGAKIKAAKKVEVKGQTITLNGELGQILTTMSDPLTDLITGVPSVGVPTVKAGGG